MKIYINKHIIKLNKAGIGPNAIKIRNPIKLSNAENNKIIAVFQGGMEFGPRALGNRSILANAVDPEMRSKINLSIKINSTVNNLGG